MNGHPRVRILFLGLTFLAFLTGAMIASLWIPLEAADAIVDDAGGAATWFVPVVLVGISGIIFAAITASHRSRGWITLTAAAAVLLVGLAFTYPSTSVACQSQTTEAVPQLGGTTEAAPPSSGSESPLDDTDLSGLQVESQAVDTAPSTSGDPPC
jgi:hypothetical protein